MHEFSESSLTPEAHSVLRDVFGYDSFRPGQAEVVATLMDGGHILAVMPTGSGKSRVELSAQADNRVGLGHPRLP